MNDTRKSLRQGRGHPLAFPIRASAARRAPIPLRPIAGNDCVQHSFTRLSKVVEAFAIFPQRAAREYDRTIHSGEVKNG
jgi:hypothetical protein